MIVNYLMALGATIYTIAVPFAFWDHFVPHIDATAEYEEYVEREAEKAAARLMEEFRNQLSQEIMQDMMDEWRKDNGYLLWDDKHKRFYDPESGCTMPAGYEGTCGPPDNGR